MAYAAGMMSRFAGAALALALIGGIFANFTNVIGRYAAGYTLEGVDEIEIYILIAIAFIGAASMTARRGHLRMDVVSNALPSRIRNVLSLVEGAITIVVCGFVAWHSGVYVANVYSLGTVSDIAGIPTFLPHASVTIAFTSITLIVSKRLMSNVLNIVSGKPTTKELQ